MSHFKLLQTAATTATVATTATTEAMAAATTTTSMMTTTMKPELSNSSPTNRPQAVKAENNGMYGSFRTLFTPSVSVNAMSSNDTSVTVLVEIKGNQFWSDSIVSMRSAVIAVFAMMWTLHVNVHIHQNELRHIFLLVTRRGTLLVKNRVASYYFGYFHVR